MEISQGTGTIVLLIAGISAAVLLLIFMSVLGGRAYNIVDEDIDDIGVSDETDLKLVIMETDNSTDCTPVVAGSFTARNASTTGTLIGAGNYTLTESTGFFNLTNAMYNNTNVSFTYECGDATMRTSIQNSIQEGFAAQEDTASYIPLIVLALVVAIVLALIIGLAVKPMGGSGGAL